MSCAAAKGCSSVVWKGEVSGEEESSVCRTQAPVSLLRIASPPENNSTKMELPAVGEHVFAVESIEKQRMRKVSDQPGLKLKGGNWRTAEGRLREAFQRSLRILTSFILLLQGRAEYLVKWRGWSSK